MADIRLAKPAAGASESVQCAPDARFVFDFPTTDATLARDGDNLNISFQDGSQLQLQGFYQEYNGENLPSFNIDGTEVAAADFFAAMNEPDLMPAAGPGTGTVANGARFHEWGDSALTGGLLHLDGLDWGFSRSFEWDDVPNAVGRNGDDWGWGASAGNTVPGLTIPPVPERPVDPNNPGDDPNNPVSPQNPGGYIPNTNGATIVVDEGALADGSGQHVLHGVSGRGAFVADVHAERGGSIELSFGGKVVTLAIPEDGSLRIAPSGDASFADVNGVDIRILGATSNGDGKWTVRYEYRLTDHMDHDKQLGQDLVRYDGDGIAITVTDGTGDVTTGRITVEVHDDVARAADDFASVAEGETVSGNVLVGNEHGGADIYGADGQGTFGGVQVRWDVPQGTPEGTDDAGHYYEVDVEGLGTAKLYDNGDYIFTADKIIDGLDAGDAPVNAPAFGYAIVDADGDVSTAVLNIAISPDPHIPDIEVPKEPKDEAEVPSTGNAAVVVDEGALAGASGQHKDHGFEGSKSFTVDVHGEKGGSIVLEDGTNTVTLEIPTGEETEIGKPAPATLTMNGVEVTITGAALGADGKWQVNYDYKLTGQQTHDQEGGHDTTLTGSIDITVTDGTGDVTHGELTVEVHDDVPTMAVASNVATVTMGADDGDAATVVVSKDAAGKEEYSWQAPDGVTTDLTDMEVGDKWASSDGTLWVTKTDAGYKFNLADDAKAGETIHVTATDTDNDTVTKPVDLTPPTITVPKVPEDPKSEDPNDVPASGKSAVVVDEGALAGASGQHKDHGFEGSKSFTVDVHGEKGGSIVLEDGTNTVTLEIPTGEETEIGKPAPATLTMNGVEVTITGAALGADGKWQVNYDYKLTGQQTHDQEGGHDTTLNGSIDITVTDGTGDVTHGELTVEVHDDVPMMEVASNVATVTMGADDGDAATVVVSKDADGKDVYSWNAPDGETTDLTEMNVGDRWASSDGTLWVTKTDAGYKFNLADDAKAGETIHVTATDTDNDPVTKPVDLTPPTITVPKVPEDPKSEDPNDVPASGKSAVVVDEGALAGASGQHQGHGFEGSKSFTVDVHGEKGGSIVLEDGTNTVTLEIPTGEETEIGKPAPATLTMNGVEVIITGAALGADGKWQVNYDYKLTGQQTHDQEGGHDTTLNGSIDITVTDGTGDVTHGELTVEVHDDTPLEPAFTSVSSGLSYENYASVSFVGDFSKGWKDGEYHKPSTVINKAEPGSWKQGYYDYYTGNGAQDSTHGNYDATVNGIYFCPTLAKFELAADGSVLSVKDNHNDYKKVFIDKNFYLTNKGLTVGGNQGSLNSSHQGDQYVWNENEVGFANSGSDGYAEAIMIEVPKSSVAYGVDIALGSIEPGDCILLTFYLTPQNNNDDNLVKTVILTPTGEEITNGTFSTTVQLPDGFTKLMVSPLPSADKGHNSGFTLQGVAFGKPVYETSVIVAEVDYGADGDAAEGALAWSFDGNGWTPVPDANGATKYLTDVTIEGGLGKGDYKVEITVDENGVMTGILKDGPKDGLAGMKLFEWHYDAEKSAGEFDQYYNFVFKDGSKEILATLTATDSDGDSIPGELHIKLTETPLERFDKVSTGYYDPNWQSDAAKDIATDFMAAENINDLIYAKGGDDIISGDGGKDAFTAVGNALGLDNTTQNAILNNVNKLQAPNAAKTQNAGKVYDAIMKDADDFAAKLDAIEDQHPNWAGNDTIYGGAGKDVLLGWGGSDYLEGDAGSDLLFAGSGNDIIIYDKADAYIDGGRGFDILLADKGTGNLSSLPNVHRVEMLIRSERGNDVKSLSINTLASLEMYGIILGGTEGAWTVELNGNWELKGNTWVYSDEKGDLLSLEVAGGVSVTAAVPAAQAEVEGLALGDDASAYAYPVEATADDSTLDAAGSVQQVAANAVFRSAAGEDEGTAGDLSHSAAASGSATRNTGDASADDGELLFGTPSDDTLMGGAGDDFIDGKGGGDVIFAGSGDDLIVYDATDYLIDGGEGIDFLLSGSVDPAHSLADMLGNWEHKGADTEMPMVHDVEVMLKGVDTSLQNMDSLAAKYGFSMDKDANGRDILVLDKGKWELDESQSGNGTNTYVNAESGITLETTLAEVGTGTDAGEQAAQTIVLANNG